MRGQGEEVPQWVKDFITQRQKQKPEERERQTSHDTYLLCRFSQDEVEVIRDGFYKIQEEKRDAVAQRNGEARKAGHLVPDSGLSINDDLLLSRIYLRDLLLVPLSRQEMQQTVAKCYGWKRWSEDPWGDSQKFYEWKNTLSDDDAQAIWAVNETLGGRVYLAYGTVWALDQLDYSEMTEEDLLTCIGFGAESFLWVKSYTGWDYFERYYPAEPLPARLVNEEIIKGWPFWSFNAYISFVSSIYLWYIALDGARERAKGHPELEGFLSILTVTDAHIADLCQKLAPKGYRFPDENQAWMKLYQALKKPLDAKERKYANVLENGGASTLGSLLEGVRHWLPKPYQATMAGLKGQLGNSLLSVVEHDFIDATRGGKRHQKRQLLEMDYRGEDLKLIHPDGSSTRIKSKKRGIDETKEAPSLFDRIPASQLGPEQLLEESENETLDLKKLGFNKEELKPRELLLLDELRDAASKGYTKDSKEGLSLKQYWGKDYDRKMKMLKRLEAKRKKP